MGIGNRKPIKFIDESPAVTSGNWVADATTILRSWAEVRERSSTRISDNGKAQFGKFFEFRFRYRGDTINVNANTRVVYDGRKYAVQSISKENGNRFYWIAVCEAKTFD